MNLNPIIIAAVLAAAASTASAAEISGAFGNTVVATYPDGRAQKIWLMEDGGYRALARSGKRSSGRWAVKDDKVCLTQLKPFPAPIRYCTAFPTRGPAIGATWTGRDIKGESIRLTVVKGMPEL